MARALGSNMLKTEMIKRDRVEESARTERGCTKETTHKTQARHEQKLFVFGTTGEHGLGRDSPADPEIGDEAAECGLRRRTDGRERELHSTTARLQPAAAQNGHARGTKGGNTSKASLNNRDRQTRCDRNHGTAQRPGRQQTTAGDRDNWRNPQVAADEDDAMGTAHMASPKGCAGACESQDDSTINLTSQPVSLCSVTVSVRNTATKERDRRAAKENRRRPVREEQQKRCRYSH
jgi:hypothetical protein